MFAILRGNFSLIAAKNSHEFDSSLCRGMKNTTSPLIGGDEKYKKAALIVSG